MTTARQAWKAYKRHQRTQRTRLEKFGSAAVVQRTRSRETGTTVAVEDTWHHESVLDPYGGRWATVCEDHGGVVNHDTLALARRFAPVPTEWCPVCQEQHNEDHDTTDE